MVHGDGHVAAAKKLLADLGGEDRFELAMLSGSRAAGLGHAFSDTDIHVIMRDSSARLKRTYEVDGVEIQLTHVSLDDLQRYARLARDYRATPTDREQMRLPERDLWHLVRFSVGVTLIGSERCRTLLAEANPDVVRQIIMANHSHDLGRAAEDAVGMGRIGEFLGAAHASVIAMSRAVEMLLSAAGSCYSMDRMLMRRVRKVLASDHYYESVWRMLYQWPSADASEIELAGCTGERLVAASGIGGWALVHGWATPTSEFPTIASAGGSGPIRTPGWCLLRFSDTFALSGTDKSYRIGERVAAVWVRLDGRPLHDVQQSLSLSGYDGLSSDDVGRCVDALRRQGAVIPSGDTVGNWIARGGAMQ